MKSVFDVILMLWLSLTFLFCMMIFSEDVLVRQEGIHIRNKVNEIVEINGGYTQTASTEINDLISKYNNQVNINFSKNGKLDFGEKLVYEIVISYKRQLPFEKNEKTVSYSISGIYYNTYE